MFGINVLTAVSIYFHGRNSFFKFPVIIPPLMHNQNDKILSQCNGTQHADERKEI